MVKINICRLQANAPNNKLVLGIPFFGRTWKIIKKSLPPFVVDGPGDEGPLINLKGKMSYMEICLLLKNSTIDDNEKHGLKLIKINDPTKRYGKLKILFVQLFTVTIKYFRFFFYIDFLFDKHLKYLTKFCRNLRL